MARLTGADRVGLRDKATKELVAVYPDKLDGTDEEITKKVRDWFYNQNCANEDLLLKLVVDVLTESELKERR